MAGAPAWDAAAALDQINRQWDGDIVRRLTEYIAVPAKSLAFDPDWAAHGFIDHVVNKKAEVVRVYLPPDVNTLLSTFDHCLRSKQYVNVVVAGKQPEPVFLNMEEAIAHCTRGLGIWDWAGTEVSGEEPDVVQDMRCEPEQGPERGSGGRPRPGGAGPPRSGRGDAVGGQSRCRGVGQAGVHTVEGA